MKRKIGTIYNKPIVTGDKNLVTRNEVHESTLKGGGIDVNKKYGYYLISPDIFDIVNESKSEIWTLLAKIVSSVVNGEFNGRTAFNRIDGLYRCVNSSIAAVRLFVSLEAFADLPYCSREYFNLGIKVDESDINYSAVISNNMINVSIKGTLLERIEESGGSEIIPYLIPITKEEYESLTDM